MDMCVVLCILIIHTCESTLMHMHIYVIHNPRINLGSVTEDDDVLFAIK